MRSGIRSNWLSLRNGIFLATILVVLGVAFLFSQPRTQERHRDVPPGRQETEPEVAKSSEPLQRKEQPEPSAEVRIASATPMVDPSEDAEPSDEEELSVAEKRASRISKALVGYWRLENPTAKVRLPPLIQFDPDGETLRFVADPDGGDQPGELLEGGFEVSPDDGALQLDFAGEWVEGASYGGKRFLPPGDKTPDAFTLDGTYRYQRVTATAFASMRKAGPAAVARAAGYGLAGPEQPEVRAALRKLEPGFRYPLALSGAAVPGASDGAHFQRFGTPIGNRDHVVFRAAFDRGEDRRGIPGRDGLCGGEIGKFMTLLRSGAVVPDAPADPEVRLERVQEPEPKRQRWITGFMAVDKFPPLLEVHRQGTVMASALVDEAGRGRSPAFLAIEKKTHSADPDFRIRTIQGEPFSRGDGLTVAVPRLAFPVADTDDLGDLRFATGTGILTLASISPRDQRGSWWQVTEWPGLARGERIAEVLDLRLNNGSIFHVRIAGEGVGTDNDEAIFVGVGSKTDKRDFTGTTLAVREGNVAPDFVASTPRIVAPRIVSHNAQDGTSWHVACDLRLEGEEQPGGGSLLWVAASGNLLKPGTLFVSHVWGTACPESRIAGVERWFTGHSAQRNDASPLRAEVRTKGQGKRAVLGLFDIGRSDLFASAAGNRRPLEESISERIAMGKKPPDFIANRKAPRGPGGSGGPTPTWAVPLEYASAEERAIDLPREDFNGSRRVRRSLDPKDKLRQVPDTGVQFLVQAGIQAPGLLKGTVVKRFVDCRNGLLVATVSESGSNVERKVCWEVMVEKGSFQALILHAAEGADIEIRPGDVRRIASLDIDPGRAQFGEGKRNAGEALGALIVYRLVFTDGSEGIFAGRMADGAFIPPGVRPLGAMPIQNPQRRGF